MTFVLFTRHYHSVEIYWCPLKFLWLFCSPLYVITEIVCCCYNYFKLNVYKKHALKSMVDYLKPKYFNIAHINNDFVKRKFSIKRRRKKNLRRNTKQFLFLFFSYTKSTFKFWHLKTCRWNTNWRLKIGFLSN